MISLAHIVNPVVVPESSDLFVAQPITFESMRRAQARTPDSIRVSLFSAQFPEDQALVPRYLTPTRDLDRSMLDLYPHAGQRKLPLLQDILTRLYEATDAQYLIYTNVDIGLKEAFYGAVGEKIEQGYDAFSITRRTVPGHFADIEDLPLIYAEAGEPHPGWDCFVFRRDIVPQFQLDGICLGVPPVGRILVCNCLRFADRFRLFTDENLTFHIGNEGTWKGGRDAAQIQNTRNGLRIAKALYRSTRDPAKRALLRPHVQRLSNNLLKISATDQPRLRRQLDRAIRAVRKAVFGQQQ